jgi:hypothetical protein
VSTLAEPAVIQVSYIAILVMLHKYNLGDVSTLAEPAVIQVSYIAILVMLHK